MAPPEYFLGHMVTLPATVFYPLHSPVPNFFSSRRFARVLFCMFATFLPLFCSCISPIKVRVVPLSFSAPISYPVQIWFIGSCFWLCSSPFVTGPPPFFFVRRRRPKFAPFAPPSAHKIFPNLRILIAIFLLPAPPYPI